MQEKIIEAINSPENSSYKTFLSNPLLLSMFILTFQSYSSIPQKRSAFYSQVFDALFSVHDSMSKLAFVREKISGLSKEQFIEILELFSFVSYFEQKFIFTNKYLNDKLNIIKEKKSSIVFINNKLITDLQIAIGIINQDGTEFTFPHRSLQEYFSASYISSLNPENKKTVYEKVTKEFSNNKHFRMNSGDNFHLLISELDELGVIEYGILPYLKSYQENINLQTKSSKKIIDYFINLANIYESFYCIIKCEDLIRKNEEFTTIFSEYLHTEAKKRKTKKEEDITISARKKLALEHIKPFLISYVSDLDMKISEL